MSGEMLDRLTAQVEAAANEIVRLRERNVELEKRLKELVEAPDTTWPAEREELQRRVEKLVARLESLLAS